MGLKRLISTTPCAPILLNESSQLLPVCIEYKSEIKIEITIVLGKFNKKKSTYTHRIHVWYIYLHLVDFYGKCR